MERILGPADIRINAYNPATQFNAPEQSQAAPPTKRRSLFVPGLIRETLINRPTRELVGGADPQIPDAEVKRSEFGEVCPGKAPHFLHFSYT
ncbi:hypothetical protein [Burkholderia anthina]|uniref:hypothetical protein n=1 Tax=Burkholderia anthina TaxID=179879 RepID=UPI00158F680F|nr:hypothetical protein [Burkholderia anthina]